MKNHKMNNSDEANKIFRELQTSADSFGDYRAEEQRKLAVYQRLRAERLAREAAAK
jgi:hypothetical protein